MGPRRGARSPTDGRRRAVGLFVLRSSLDSLGPSTHNAGSDVRGKAVGRGAPKLPTEYYIYADMASSRIQSLGAWRARVIASARGRSHTGCVSVGGGHSSANQAETSVACAPLICVDSK